MLAVHMPVIVVSLLAVPMPLIVVTVGSPMMKLIHMAALIIGWPVTKLAACIEMASTGVPMSVIGFSPPAHRRNHHNPRI
jgi:hypothetical protein